MRYWYGVVLLLLSASWACAARTVTVDQPLALRLEHNQTTAVLLPETIASVTTGVPPNQFSFDYDGPYVFVVPLTPEVTGRLFVVGSSGKMYLFTFAVSTPSDDIVTLTTPRTAREPGISPAAPLSLSQMVRALRTQTALPGEQSTDLPAPTLPDTVLTLVSSKAVAWGTTVGLTVTVQNSSPVPHVLEVAANGASTADSIGVAHVSRWVFPPRHTVKALALEHETLEAGAQTRVYIVLERRP